MGKVTTIKGDLFDAPKGSIIIHACNTKGVWGSGIAKAFAQRFPKARDIYAQACQEKGASLLGTCLLIPAGDYTIACLFTSKNYGQFVDKPAKILESTESAIADLIKQNVERKSLHTCKINSGLFRVPWNDTKAILKATDSEFTVYDY
jgi:ADP-ribose 1''-phosphate phosphatase